MKSAFWEQRHHHILQCKTELSAKTEFTSFVRQNVGIPLHGANRQVSGLKMLSINSCKHKAYVFVLINRWQIHDIFRQREKNTAGCKWEAG